MQPSPNPSLAAPANQPLLAAALVSAATAAYTATVCWEHYEAPTYRTTTITRHLRLNLHMAPGSEAGERVLDLYASGHQVRQQENRQPVAPEPVEAWAQRLAALYAGLRLRVAASGAWVEVLNQAAIARTWAGLRAELGAESAPDEPLLAGLLAAVDRQVADPGAVLRSLRYDYLYQMLAGGWPSPPPPAVAGGAGSEAAGWSAGRPRCFRAFLPGTDLWFSEQARAEQAEPGSRALAVRGTLDPARTDLTAALPPAPDPADRPPPPRAGYHARIRLDTATNLPTHVALRVYVRQGDFYNKEYTLTLDRA